MNKKFLLFGLPILAIGLVAAAIATYYALATITLNVNQPIDVSGNLDQVVDCDAGDTCLGEAITINNDGESDRVITLSDNSGSNIEVSYYKILGYNSGTIGPISGSIPADVVVEDLGDKVKWTIDMDETDEDFANGHAALGLIIGIGDNILYQVHSNDGTDDSYDWGTWLVSPYDPELDSSCEWNGWHSSCVNEEVTNLDWVSATGERDLVNNPALIYTITIDKDKLDVGEFKWAMALMGDTRDTYIPSYFSWADEDTTHFSSVQVGTELTSSVIVPAGSFVEFYPVFDVNKYTSDGERTIQITIA